MEIKDWKLNKSFGLKKNEKLSQHTSFCLGGPAKYFVMANSAERLMGLIKLAQKNKYPFFVFGAGSNTVFEDKGFNGLVIKFKSQRQPTISNHLLIAEAGQSLAKIITLAIKNGLGGLEYLSGIPGTIGGAVVGNAGAYEHFIGDLVEWVEVYDGQKIRRLSRAECHFGYRDSLFKKRQWLILKICLCLNKADKNILNKISRGLIVARHNKYNGLLCAGSFFKNVPISKISKKNLKKIEPIKILNKKIPVGYLIEVSGGKNLVVGDIEVADFHANFLINRGNGKTRDLKKLVKKIKNLVENKFGVRLEEEVRFVAY
ncbi:MAG: UDP-N-acetylmuramate dehydrogenase [Candidatus Paceibacterota bacterium]|jgi:UDP-N-acetylmuramate dehydrogenase